MAWAGSKGSKRPAAAGAAPTFRQQLDLDGSHVFVDVIAGYLVQLECGQRTSRDFPFFALLPRAGRTELHSAKTHI